MTARRSPAARPAREERPSQANWLAVARAPQASADPMPEPAGSTKGAMPRLEALLAVLAAAPVRPRP
ncbi:MAG: hypothetical protein M3Q90_05450, partial [Candidatus Dormibacteraeota bacterium]|nr:hypothetical protein [Candidatus Dormibacteraeota bacterium]